ncbi:S8 family serine peptidase [candidate division KSB1 bacterium]|nr:S8 family serine peptidase [candidate division KSB1 bacterium]
MKRNYSVSRMIQCIIILFILLQVKNAVAEDPPLFHKGMIYIKLKQGDVSLGLQKAGTRLGIMSLDQRFRETNVTRYKKTFKHRPIPQGSDLPDLSRIYTIYFPEDVDVQEMVDKFSEDPNVEYVEPVTVDYYNDIPNDSSYQDLDHLAYIQAEEAWDIHKGELGDSTVIVGIIDGGADWSHPDLQDNVWQNPGEDADGDGHTLEWIDSTWVFDPGDENGIDDDQNGYVDDFIGWNFCSDHDWSGNQSNNPMDVDGHGSHVAGIAAGVTNNNLGISSISWNVKFLPSAHSIYVYGDYYILNAYQGMIYLAENGADIINCSYGSYSGSQVKEEAVDYATALGSIVVAAAGNSGSEQLEYPAAYPKVVSVGATNDDQSIAYFSTYGMNVDICAPGTNILSTYKNGNYAYGSGTSMASPLVVGLLGLIKSYHPDWTNDQLLTQLFGTAINIDSFNPGYENKLGYGVINAYHALADTDVTLPRQFKLVWDELVRTSGTDSTSGLSPGQTGRFSFSVQNHTYFGRDEAVTLILTTDDPSIEILEYEHSVFIQPNSNTEISDAFLIKIKEDALPHQASFTVTVDPSVSVPYGGEMTFQVMVGASGILVWEAEPGLEHFSGTFIRDFLQERGMNVVYTNAFPQSLVGFQSVLLSWGAESWTIGSDMSVFSLENKRDILIDYLKKGGNVYMEGRPIMQAMNEDTNFCALFGVEEIHQTEEGYFTTYLQGNEGSLAQDMIFSGSSEYKEYGSADLFIPNTNGMATLQVKDTMVVAVEGIGAYGQKTFCMSHALAQLIDSQAPSSRFQLLTRILDFFDIDVPMYANFNVEAITNTTEFQVQFYDLSYPDSSSSIQSWAWDFNGDGSIDSYEQNPQWTYAEEGGFDVELSVSDGTISSERLKANHIHAYENGSALRFTSTDNAAYVPLDSSLDLTYNLTVEFWIKPDSALLNEYYSAQIMEKQMAFMLFLYTDLSLELDLELEDDNSLYIYTDENVLEYNQWQHISITFDGEDARVHIYRNGDLVLVRQNREPFLGLTYEWNVGNLDLKIGKEFIGLIDELRIWGITRTQEEIERDFNIRLNGLEEGLAAYWPMDEGCGDFIMDHTGNNNTGVLSNTTWGMGVNTIISGIDESQFSLQPAIFALYNNYPNPFNPTTTIEYDLPVDSEVQIYVFNIKGQKVCELVNLNQPTGHYQASWSGKNDRGQQMSTGIYFIRMEAGDFKSVRKMMLLK